MCFSLVICAQVRLQHGDRLVLGPARLVCIYVSEPLTLAEKNNWTYDFALNEARSNKAWELLSPARRAAAEALASVREEQVMYSSVAFPPFFFVSICLIALVMHL